MSSLAPLICFKCKSEVSDDDEFCPVCGNSTETVKKYRTRRFPILKVSSYDGITNLILAVDKNHTLPKSALTASHNDMQRALNALKRNEAQVLIRLYGLDGKNYRTLTSVGKEVGVTKERIRQIEKQGLQKLRHPKLARIFLGSNAKFLYQDSDTKENTDA